MRSTVYLTIYEGVGIYMVWCWEIDHMTDVCVLWDRCMEYLDRKIHVIQSTILYLAWGGN